MFIKRIIKRKMECHCGKRVFEYMNHMDNVIVRECSETGYVYSKGKDGKVTFIRGRARPCSFREIERIGGEGVVIPQRTIQRTIVASVKVSEDEKNLQQLLDSSTLDRNLLIWYILNKDLAEYAGEVARKIRTIDLQVLGQLRGLLLVLRNYPKFSLVYEIIGLLKKYTLVDESDLGYILAGMNHREKGVEYSIKFYRWVTDICEDLEKNGFDYVKPVFGGVYNAKHVPTKPSEVIKTGFQYSTPLVLEDGADLFESDEEDRKDDRKDSDSESDSMSRTTDSESDSDSDSIGSHQGTSDEEDSAMEDDGEDDGEDRNMKKLLKKLNNSKKAQI